MSTSVRELLATPSTSRRNLNATYIKSVTRNVIPDCASFKVKKNVLKISNQLKEIGLLNAEWRAYRVNALYDFSYKKLIHYEKILTSQIKEDMLKLESDLPNKFQHIVTKIQQFPGLISSERDSPSIKITVEVEDEEGCLVPHFIGFLLSVERKSGFMEEERNAAKAVILPLFLLNYDDDFFLESVKYFLVNNFSCYVGSLKFSTYDLIFMLFLFSSPIEEKKEMRKKIMEKKVSSIVNYKGPSEEISSIRYAIDHETMTEMWKEITSPLMEEISEEEVYDFFSVLEEKFYKMFSVNVSHFDLQSIRTPLAQIQADSYIKVYESNKSCFVIRHLTHLAQELIQLK